jgi:glutaconate CoA-transferase subunit A
VIHALRADREGNVLLEGIVGVQKEAVLAAKRSLVTVEEVVDDLRAAQRQRRDPAGLDGGRHRRGAGRRLPSYAQGYYPRDNAFYIAWDKIARDRDTFLPG